MVTSRGGTVPEPFDVPVGRAVMVADPFGNVLVLLDLSKGTYRTGQHPPGDGLGQ